MDFWEIVVLAAIQGLTEFLPVSSSGHLVVARVLFGISDADGNAFDAFLHLGTLVAVLIYFRSIWWALACALVIRNQDGEQQRRLSVQLAVATLPAALVGFMWREVFETYFRVPQAVALGFGLSAVALLVADISFKHFKSVRDMTVYDALLVGVAQLIALVPGVSRSGMTIAAGLWRGLSRRDAATFSFLLSAPIIAAAGLSSFGLLLTNGAFSYRELVVGFTVSLVAGLFAIHGLLKLLEQTSFLPFVVYLLAVAGVVLYAGS